MEYIKFFANKVKHLKLLTLEEKGELLDAMIAYAFDGTETELHTNAKYVWPSFKEMLDESSAAYKTRVENGKKHQANRDTTEPQPNTNQEPTENAQETRNKKQETRNKKQETILTGESGAHAPAPAPAKAFAPPTVDEAAAYMATKGGTRSQAERFTNYFDSNGWRVGRNPMKNWKAAANNWLIRDREEGPPPGRTAPVKAVPEQLYSQRDYGSGNIIPDDWLEAAQ